MERVAYYLAARMDRVKSLNLSIPTSTTEGWMHCLQQRAPLLQFFSMRNHTFQEMPQLPFALFGDHAPCLRTLSLDNAYFPTDPFDSPSPALGGVCALYFYTGGSFDDDELLEFLDRMPSLEQLTITGVIEYDGLVSRCGKAIELRLNSADRIEEAVACFPNAESVVYSFAAGHIGGTDVLGLVESALCSRTVSSLDMTWTPARDKDAPHHSGDPQEYHSASVNGHPLLVDIHISRLCAALTAVDVVVLLPLLCSACL
ncbi:hypothetical protein AURDEDRAFT_173671 [Auricularia subglabra TFB-10046 SS5]|nr:hypothetical protein AURDEDRAFT_173671 [Auricularia subglabra TFB-10046 SS5]